MANKRKRPMTGDARLAPPPEMGPGFDIEDIQDNSLRPDFRIIRSCMNCKFFYYQDKTRTRRGLCFFPEMPGRKATVEKRTDLHKFGKTHATCVCDNHIIASSTLSIENVTLYCGAEWQGE